VTRSVDKPLKVPGHEPQPEPQSEPQPEPQSEPRPEPQSEPQPEPQSEPRPEPAPEADVADVGRPEDHPQSIDHRVGPAFWVSAAAGWVVIAIGLRGVFMNSIDTRPANLAKFVVGGALLHDLLLAPLALVAAVLVVRAVPGRARAPVQAALVVTAVLALFSYPLVRAFGLAANNPTSLPHNYALNLTIVLGVVWAVAAAALAFRLRKSA